MGTNDLPRDLPVAPRRRPAPAGVRDAACGVGHSGSERRPPAPGGARGDGGSVSWHSRVQGFHFPRDGAQSSRAGRHALAFSCLFPTASKVS